MSSSSHIDNKKKDILVLEKGQIQGLDHTLTAEKMFSINFTITKKKQKTNKQNKKLKLALQWSK